MSRYGWWRPHLGGSGGRTLEKSRHVVLRVEDVLLAIFSLTWLVRTAIYKELGLVLRTPLNKAIAFYVIVCVVSTSFSYLLASVIQ